LGLRSLARLLIRISKLPQIHHILAVMEHINTLMALARGFNLTGPIR